MTWNAHRAFASSSSGCFLDNLKVDDRVEDSLTQARDDVRSRLRTGFSNWTQFSRREELFGNVPHDWRLPALRPKFRMQGSFAYRTHVSPAWVPPQQTDLDDGLFLPVSFVSRNGTLEPIAASEALFALVEKILEPLCRERGWELVPMSSCVRIQLSKTEHMDVAIYAISDEAFLALLEKAAMARSDGQDIARRALRDSIDLDDLTYASLSGEQIALAHRTSGWKRSDPRKLDTWVKSAVAKHGDQFRRLSRYLKGWRDFQFKVSRLASIALMSAVDTACRDAEVIDDRDDLALLAVADRLPGILSSRIDNPVVDGERLDEKWSPEQRKEYVDAAKLLAATLQRALDGASTKSEALAKLISLFGPRFPNDTSLIVGDSALETKSAVHTAPALASTSVSDKLSKLENAFTQTNQSTHRSRPWAPLRD